MSCHGKPSKFWKLGAYKFPFYRFEIDRLYQKHMNQKAMVLDAGCGSYTTTLSSVPQNVTLVCIDISKKNTTTSHKKSKKKNLDNVAYIQTDVSNLPFRNDTFDLIASQDVIEHVHDAKKVTQEAYRVCKNGGVFAGTTSNLLNPLFMLDSYVPKQLMMGIVNKFAGDHHYGRHMRLTSKGLINSLKKSGFKKIGMTLIGYPLFKAWEYQSHGSKKNKKIPIYAYFWIAFDKITKIRPLHNLKEAIVFYAIKTDD